ncbi:hypothetical protein M422DRAFT_31857, partial [Sphaerobolus stellatus SS14]
MSPPALPVVPRPRELKGYRAIPLPIAQLSLAAVLKCGQSFRWIILDSPIPLHASNEGEERDEWDELEDELQETETESEDEDPFIVKPKNAKSSRRGGWSELMNTEYRFALRDRVVCLRQNEEAIYYRSLFPSPTPNAATATTTTTTTTPRLKKRKLTPSSSSPSAVASTSSPAAPPHILSSPSPSADAEVDPEASTLAWIQDYFSLSTNLVGLYTEWARHDPVFARVNFRGRFEGIRILRQDPWECLISFICSQNNHISRISKMVQSLCTHFSPALSIPPHASPSTPTSHSQTSTPLTYHPFPPPTSLASPSVSSTLRALGFGYRAEYIQRTAQMLVDAHGADEGPEKFLRGLREVDTAEARAALLEFMGVGRKVADCVLLMSLDKHDVVPVDTHVHKIAIKHYGLRGSPGGEKKVAMTPKLYDEVQMKLAGVWGAYAGWAHSVLFTSDLKSFAMYGLPTPSPEKAKAKAKVEGKEVALEWTSPAYGRRAPPRFTTPESPSPKGRKRKREEEGEVLMLGEKAVVKVEEVEVKREVKRRKKEVEVKVKLEVEVKLEEEVAEEEEGDTMADRIKRRRKRGKAVTTKAKVIRTKTVKAVPV